MKKTIFAFTLALTLGLSCKPEVYLGPLDNPMGNWKSSESIYYFNGETVYQKDITDNWQRLAVIDIGAPVVADQALVEVHSTYGDDNAKIFEVRIY